MSETKIVREFPVELSEGDGRTIDLRIVPYGVAATVADPPDYQAYQEEWVAGAFDNQLQAAHRVAVFLNFEHEEGVRGIVGHGTELEDRGDALYGSFRVHPNADGDKTLDLVRDGVLTGVSLEAIPLRSTRKNGVVQRVRAHLDKVSLVRTGREAFKQHAMVLAVREAPLADVPKLPVLDPELVKSLSRMGFTVPGGEDEDDEQDEQELETGEVITSTE